MTNQTTGNEPITTLPMLSRAELDLDAMWKRTADADTQGVQPYPNFGGSGSLYPKHLLGVAFVFVSGPVFRLQDGKFGQQEVAQAWVRLFDEQWKLGEPQLATFTGIYMVSRLAQATERDLVGSYIFTVWANPAHTRVDGKHPLMVKRYQAGDMPPDTDDVWGGGEQHTPPSSVQTRIQEIETAGAVPPPWEALPPSAHPAARGKK